MMHYYKRNIGDYAKRTGRLTMLEHGAYTLLHDACYDRERFPTEDEAVNWCWARDAQEIDAVRFVLQRFFVCVDGIYIHEQIQADLLAYKRTCDNNARIATEREEKRTERLRSVYDSCTERAQIVHEAPPNQEPITNNQEPKEEKPARKRAHPAKPDDVSQEVWDGFLAIRKARRSPLTDAALDGINREAKAAGMCLETALKTCCARGWQGFKANWLKADGKPSPHTLPSMNSYADSVPEKLRPAPVDRAALEEEFSRDPSII